MKSKEKDILELFFNYPTKEWHFEDICHHGKIARSKADRWIKRFMREHLILRIKKKGKMPYYLSNYDSPSYKNRKKLFAYEQLYESGFLNHLLELPQARTIILFGSFNRSDWYNKSDIDVFIYGKPEGLHLAKYEQKLKREIQLFVCDDKKTLERFGSGFLYNIFKGNILKGDLDFVTLGLHA